MSQKSEKIEIIPYSEKQTSGICFLYKKGYAYIKRLFFYIKGYAYL